MYFFCKLNGKSGITSEFLTDFSDLITETLKITIMLLITSFQSKTAKYGHGSYNAIMPKK